MASIISGINFKTLPEILNDMKQRLLVKYPGLNVSEESVTNQILASPAVEMAIIYEELEKVFFSHYPLYAEGLALDFSMQFTGNKRLAGRPQIIELTYKGSPATIPSDAKFFASKNPNFVYESKKKFDLTSDSTFQIQTMQDIDFSVFPGDSIQPRNRIPGLQSLVVKRVIQNGVQFESDARLKERYFSQLSLTSLETTEAINSKIRSRPGVENVIIISNTNDYPDLEGRPPGSLEIIVSGGNDQEIAETIEAVVSPGTILIGTPYKLKSGNVVRFSRALSVPIFFLIEISIDPRIFDSTDEEIIQSFAKKCRETFTQGEDIILSPVCLGFLSEFKGISFALIRAGTQSNVYSASSGSNLDLDLTRDGRIDETDLSVFMSAYNRNLRSARKPNQIVIDKNEKPVFSDENIKIQIKTDSSFALSVPIEIRASFLVDATFPEDGENQIQNAFVRVVDNLEIGRSVSVFQVLAPSIQNIGNYLEANIKVRKVGETTFSQYVTIENSQLATLAKESIQIQIRRRFS